MKQAVPSAVAIVAVAARGNARAAIRTVPTAGASPRVEAVDEAIARIRALRKRKNESPSAASKKPGPLEATSRANARNAQRPKRGLQPLEPMSIRQLARQAQTLWRPASDDHIGTGPSSLNVPNPSPNQLQQQIPRSQRRRPLSKPPLQQRLQALLSRRQFQQHQTLS